MNDEKDYDTLQLSRFNSYQGLYQILPNYASMSKFLGNLAELIGKRTLVHKTNQSESGIKHKQEIKIIDTFFSDTIVSDSKLLEDLVLNALNEEYTIQILLYDPFSEISKMRLKALQKNDYTDGDEFIETNRALFALRQAFNRNTKENFSEEAYKESNQIFQQLEAIKSLCEGFKGRLEIKFYKKITELPVYIVGDYLFKGLILSDETSKNNPWLVFVDDISNGDDMYSKLHQNFNNIWDQEETNTISAYIKNGKDSAGREIR